MASYFLGNTLSFGWTGIRQRRNPMRHAFSSAAILFLLLTIPATVQSETTATSKTIKPITTVAPKPTVAPAAPQRKMSAPKNENIKTTVSKEAKAKAKQLADMKAQQGVPCPAANGIDAPYKGQGSGPSNNGGLAIWTA
jgi:hypothetical protein